MYNVYVGSTNIVKVNAVKKVLPEYNIVAKVVNSGVSLQPLSDEETIAGAKTRAENLPLDGLRIGLEAGVNITGNTMFLVNWGVLIDQNNNYYFAGGTRIPLPEFIKDKILNDKLELAEVMDEYFKTSDIKHKEGTIGFFTNNLVKRIDIFMHIVKLLYGQYKKKGS